MWRKIQNTVPDVTKSKIAQPFPALGGAVLELSTQYTTLAQPFLALGRAVLGLSTQYTTLAQPFLALGRAVLNFSFSSPPPSLTV